MDCEICSERFEQAKALMKEGNRDKLVAWLREARERGIDHSCEVTDRFAEVQRLSRDSRQERA